MSLLLVLFLLFIPHVLAAFNHANSVCWQRNCVVRKDTGTLCFVPQDNGIAYPDCVDNVLKTLLQVHLNSSVGQSLTYYNDNAMFLGAATWSIGPSLRNATYICMSGQYTQDRNSARTVCRKTVGDDDMEIAEAHVEECVVEEAPKISTDGCIPQPTTTKGGGKHYFYEQPGFAGLGWFVGILASLGAIIALVFKSNGVGLRDLTNRLCSAVEDSLIYLREKLKSVYERVKGVFCRRRGDGNTQLPVSNGLANDGNQLGTRYATPLPNNVHS